MTISNRTTSTTINLNSVTSPLAKGPRLAASLLLGAAVLLGLPAFGHDRAEAQTILRGPPVIMAAGTALRGMRNPTVRAAVIRGNQQHRQAFNRSWGPGFQQEFRLPNGRRIDGVDFARRHVTEVKPNNARAIARGREQARAYRDQLERLTGQPWTFGVRTYGQRR